MSDARADTARKIKPASGPKTPRGRKRHKPYRRNALYSLAAEYKKRHSQATAQDAWRHFAGLVGMSTVLIAFDSTADTLAYVPDPGRVSSRIVTRRTFFNQWYRIPRGDTR